LPASGVGVRQVRWLGRLCAFAASFTASVLDRCTAAAACTMWVDDSACLVKWSWLVGGQTLKTMTWLHTHTPQGKATLEHRPNRTPRTHAAGPRSYYEHQRNILQNGVSHMYVVLARALQALSDPYCQSTCRFVCNFDAKNKYLEN